MEQELGPKAEKKLSHKGTLIYWTPGGPSAGPLAPKTTVVLLHNMWANHRVLHRHVRLFHDLGYNCATYNIFKGSTLRDSRPFGFFEQFCFMHQLWVKQLQDVLDSIEGKKIVFGMSGPSIAGILASHSRTDITHLICDSGPFKEVWQCTYRLFSQIMYIPTVPLRALITTGAVLVWGPNAFRRSQSALNNWDPAVPILSIRGGKDPIVLPQNIEGIFENHPHLNIKTSLMPEAHHIDGLKLFPEEYKKEVSLFLGAR